MKSVRNTMALMAFSLLLGGTMALWGCGGGSKSGATAKNPCGANPCNPCGANPCNPCGGNPCGGNPCGGGAKMNAAMITAPDGWSANAGGLDAAALLAKGEELWNDASIGTSKSSCNTCHMTPALYKPSFAKAYPHEVAMPKQKAGKATVTASEMVQFCMLAPMASKPFAWDSVELAALTAVVEKKQKEFAASGGGAAANPCGGNPCGGNPCGGM